MEKNYYYTILGVKKDASQDEIKKAYHRMAKVFHPDSGTANDEMFKMVNEAYATLGDPKKRKDYDWQQEGSSYNSNSSYSNRSSYSSGNSSSSTYNSSNFGGDRRFTREYFHREEAVTESNKMENPWNYAVFRMVVLSAVFAGIAYAYTQDVSWAEKGIILAMFVGYLDAPNFHDIGSSLSVFVAKLFIQILPILAIVIFLDNGSPTGRMFGVIIMYIPTIIGVIKDIKAMTKEKVKKTWVTFFVVFFIILLLLQVAMFQCAMDAYANALARIARKAAYEAMWGK